MRTPSEILSGAYNSIVRWLDRIAEDGLLRMFWWRIKGMFGHRMVARKLIPGERVISEVMRAPILYVVPGLIALFGLFLLVRWLLPLAFDEVDDNAWLPALVVLGILGYAFYQFLKIRRDRFVVTDSRVFRVWGVFTLHEAEMEIVRVLDITVERPWYMRPLATGNVILENAAQEQGLREIRIVQDPELIAMDIHRRRRQMMGLGGDEESLTPPRPPSSTPRSRRRPDHPRSPGPITARRR
ncbi:MAG TPA: PH domain-containing protein [Jiangellaceae bacterium]